MSTGVQQICLQHLFWCNLQIRLKEKMHGNLCSRKKRLEGDSTKSHNHTGQWGASCYSPGQKWCHCAATTEMMFWHLSKTQWYFCPQYNNLPKCQRNDDITPGCQHIRGSTSRTFPFWPEVPWNHWGQDFSSTSQLVSSGEAPHKIKGSLSASSGLASLILTDLVKGK